MTGSPAPGSQYGHVFCTSRCHIERGTQKMKTNWEHQKKAIATDQKLRAEDEHLREIDKRHLMQSEESAEVTPRKAQSAEAAGEKERNQKRRSERPSRTDQLSRIFPKDSGSVGKVNHLAA